MPPSDLPQDLPASLAKVHQATATRRPVQRCTVCNAALAYPLDRTTLFVASALLVAPGDVVTLTVHTQPPFPMKGANS